MKCKHVSCGTSEKVWLSHTYKGRERGLKPHFYCINCGLVKSASSEKPREIGYYINLVSNLNRFYKVTKIQMRMISQELANYIADDNYGMDRTVQEKLFKTIVRKYINLPENYLEELLH